MPKKKPRTAKQKKADAQSRLAIAEAKKIHRKQPKLCWGEAMKMGWEKQLGGRKAANRRRLAEIEKGLE